MCRAFGQEWFARIPFASRNGSETKCAKAAQMPRVELSGLESFDLIDVELPERHSHTRMAASHGLFFCVSFHPPSSCSMRCPISVLGETAEAIRSPSRARLHKLICTVTLSLDTFLCSMGGDGLRSVTGFRTPGPKPRRSALRCFADRAASCRPCRMPFRWSCFVASPGVGRIRTASSKSHLGSPTSGDFCRQQRDPGRG